MTIAAKNEKDIELVRKYDQTKDGSVEDFCKANKIGTSFFYYHRKKFKAEKTPQPRAARMTHWRSDDKATIRKLETQNEVLKEMLADEIRKAA